MHVHPSAIPQVQLHQSLAFWWSAPRTLRRSPEGPGLAAHETMQGYGWGGSCWVAVSWPHLLDPNAPKDLSPDRPDLRTGCRPVDPSNPDNRISTKEASEENNQGEKRIKPLTFPIKRRQRMKNATWFAKLRHGDLLNRSLKDTTTSWVVETKKAALPSGPTTFGESGLLFVRLLTIYGQVRALRSRAESPSLACAPLINSQ